MSKAPRILLMNRVYPPHRGATGRMLRDLVVACREQGWGVDVLATGPEHSQFKDSGAKIHLIKAKQNPQSAIDYALIWRALKRSAIKMDTPDLIITMTDPPMLCVIGDQIAEQHNIPHIHWSHDVYPDLLPALNYAVPKWGYKILRRHMLRSLKNAHSIVTIGQDMKRYLKSSGLQLANFVTIPNWSNTDLPKPSGKNKFNIKSLQNYALLNTKKKTKSFEKLIKADLKFRVLYAGNMGKAHPIQTILKAAIVLNKTQPDIEFTFVGDGPKFDRIAKWRAEHQLDNIRLLPYQPEDNLRDILESGDVHLITMKPETKALLVPCKFYAALCVARPSILIGPKECEIASVIKEFSCGTVIKDGDAKVLARRISRYRHDSDMWFKAHKGAMAAHSHYSYKKSIALWIKTIQAIDPQHFKARKAKTRTTSTKQKSKRTTP